MKRINLIISFLSLISLFSCNKISNSEENKIPKENLLSTIYIASDLHLFSNNLIDENKKKSITGDGRIQEFDYQLVQSLVDEVNSSHPNYLVLTGDLTFNGEKDSHLELISFLDKIDSSTKVLVIPGNHDINNISSKSYLDNKIDSVDNISYEDFRNLYSKYGYSNGISYDESTLSYFYKLDENTYGLCIDSTLSTFNYEEGLNAIGGYLYESTFRWIEDNLSMAKKQGKRVISFMHHNLITHNDLFETLYTLSNSEQLLELYSQYDVNLNFSGHLHIQSIKSKIMNEKKIYDVCNQSLLDYGNRYGVLNIYANCYEYSSRRLVNEELLEYSFNTFYQKYYDKSLSSFKSSYPSNYQELLDFSSKINTYYFDGDYQKIYQIKKARTKIAKYINSNKFDNKYIKSLMNLPNINQDQIDIYI